MKELDIEALAEQIAIKIAVKLVESAPALVRSVVAELDVIRREQTAADYLVHATSVKAREDFERAAHERETQRAESEAQVFRAREAFASSPDFAALDPNEQQAFLAGGDKPADFERRAAILHRLRAESPHQVLAVDFGLLWRFISFAERDRLEAGENLDEGELVLRRQRARLHYRIG